MSDIVVPRNFKLLAELETAEKTGGSCPFISLGLEVPNDKTLSQWNGSIMMGPDAGSFANRFYSLSVNAGPEYPNVPPTVRFQQRTKLSCVDDKGVVNLRGLWGQNSTLESCLIAIRNLMYKEKGTAQPPEGVGY